MTDFNTDVERCLSTLAAGGVILYPTDTVWGLGCDATNEAAVTKLISLTRKTEQTGLVVLLGSERDVLQYVANPDMEVFNFLADQTNPTTVIYDNGLNVAGPVLNADGTIAIRLVAEEFCRHLVKRFKKPVVSTLASFYNSPAPALFNQIDAELIKAVDYVVQYRQSDMCPTRPSAIVKWFNNGTVTFIRK